VYQLKGVRIVAESLGACRPRGKKNAGRVVRGTKSKDGSIEARYDGDEVA
jgi:hypothetical protein